MAQGDYDWTKDHNRYKPYNEGWVCPKCGKSNAPWVASCSCTRYYQPYPYYPFYPTQPQLPYEYPQITCRNGNLPINRIDIVC